VPIAPCRDYAARLKQAGADVAMAEYPDSYHAYDNAAIVTPVKFPQAQTSRNCRAEEAEAGQLINSKTRQPYGLDDPCVERGTQVAYNEAAHKATVAAVKEFSPRRSSSRSDAAGHKAKPPSARWICPVV
jgi:dienelactone hydrolase